MAKTTQDGLAAIVQALRPFAAKVSMASGKRIKVRLSATHDATQLNAVLSQYPAIQRGNGGVLYIHYGERDTAEVAKLVNNESTEPNANPD